MESKAQESIKKIDFVDQALIILVSWALVLSSTIFFSYLNTSGRILAPVKRQSRQCLGRGARARQPRRANRREVREDSIEFEIARHLERVTIHQAAAGMLTSTPPLFRLPWACLQLLSVRSPPHNSYPQL